MEDLRDERVAAILTSIQCEMRYHLAKAKYQNAIKRRDALEVLQNNIRAFCYLKDWEWMKIIFKIKPLISQAEDQKALENLEKAFEEVKANLEKEVKRRKELEELEVVVRQVRFHRSKLFTNQKWSKMIIKIHTNFNVSMIHISWRHF